MDALRINFSETEDHGNLIRELKEMLELYTDAPKRRKLLGEIVCYYLFQDYDPIEACVHMKKLIYMKNKFNDIQVSVIRFHFSCINSRTDAAIKIQLDSLLKKSSI